MKKLFYLILISLLSFSCSNELGRGEAKDKIEDFFEYPNVELTSFPGVTSSQKLNNEYQILLGQNFISTRRKGRYGNKFWIIMTVKGKAFVHSGEPSYQGYEVASSVLELNEVTGIRLDDGKNTAIVDFTLKRTKVTPFGKVKGFNNGDIIKNQTTFQLYDDGWRIASNKPRKIIKVESVKGFDSDYLNNLNKIYGKLTMETGKSNCKVKEIYNKYGADFIVVDYVKMAGESEMSGAPIFENNNPKLRTFLLLNDTVLQVINLESGGEMKLTVKDFQNYIKEKDVYYNINVKNGVVKYINEIYIP